MKKLLGVALALARKYQLPLRNASRSIETKRLFRVISGCSHAR